MPDPSCPKTMRQGGVGTANLEARYDNHSGAKARDRLRDRLRARLEGDSRPIAQKLRDRMDGKDLSPPNPARTKEDMDEQYGKDTADAMAKMMFAAFSSPKWKEAEAAAIKIRDRTDLDSCEKGFLQAKLLEWAASP